MRTWAERAAEAKEEGYDSGGRLEFVLERHLKANFPEKVVELGGDLKSYLETMVWDAMMLWERLEDEGTPLQMAKELAMEHLLPKPTEA
jgi:hypothetical protein